MFARTSTENKSLPLKSLLPVFSACSASARACASSSRPMRFIVAFAIFSAFSPRPGWWEWVVSLEMQKEEGRDAR